MDVNSLNLEPGGCLSVINRKQFVAGESATVGLEYKVKQGGLNKGGHLWLLADIRQVSDSFQITVPERPGFVRAWATGGQSLHIACPGEGRPGELVRSLDLLPVIPEFLFLVEIMVKDLPLAAGDRI